ncbi:DUF3099 domain-containing protein [Corynebacterium sp. P5875]|uniref:DUF3099 domain-containing protein n=1 Tax=Corynebacterium antarcticum TaxID=2800405 RepID=A0A9Q4CCY6_9CORY|nr:DUF3099 domain-containing protein [Corynebacterium antarcticum]MCX7537199.1 DUF3099 domain-containing protein [Corynebacterium antarcticum]
MVQQRSDDEPGGDSGGHTSADRSSRDSVTAAASAPARRRGLRRLLPRRGRVELITDARQTPLDNLNARRRKYAILQGSRIPFLLASAATWVWWENTWISVILFVISVPLPWIAVVIGNGAGEPRDPRVKQVYKPAVIRERNAQHILQTDRTPELGPTILDADDDGTTPSGSADPGGPVIDHD